MKKIVLKRNGKILDPNPPRQAFVDIAAELEKLPDEELKYAEDVATLFKIGICSIRFFAHEPRFAQYTYRHGRNIYYGNPRAIVALKQFLAENGK